MRRRKFVKPLIGIMLMGVALFAGQSFASMKTFEYDDLNRLEKIEYDDGSSIGYTYDRAGNRETLTTVGTPPGPHMVAAPYSLDFGTVVVGSTSEIQIVTVTSTGDVALDITAVGIWGEFSSQFSVGVENCTTSQPLDKGETCTIEVMFSPIHTTIFDYTYLRIASNDAASPKEIVLEGTGVTSVQPTCSLSTSSINFGSVYVGGLSTERTITATNIGTEILKIYDVEVLAAPDNPWFQITSDNCKGESLSQNASCSIKLVFDAPHTVMTDSAELRIRHNGINDANPVTEALAHVSLTGAAIARSEIGVSPLAVNFGDVLVGTPSENQWITITNTGGAPLNIYSIDKDSGADADQFSIMETGACLNEGPIAAHCSFFVKFTPSNVGATNALLNVSTNDPLNGTVSIVLAGNGFIPSKIGLYPGNMSLGWFHVGESSTAQTIMASNNGSNPILLESVGFSVANAAEFTKTADSCTGITLSSVGTCNISFVFSPQSVGAKSATIDISTNEPGNPVARANIAAEGLPTPTISLLPGALSFSDTISGQHSAEQTVTISNIGSANLSTGGRYVEGTNETEFAITGSNCYAPLAQGEYCTIDIKFEPQSAGAKSANLIVGPTNDPLTPVASVSLSGLALPPPLEATPTYLNFGSTYVGKISPSKTILVTNQSGVGIYMVEAFTVGADRYEYEITADTCYVWQTPLLSGGSCNINVVFAPQSGGTKNMAKLQLVGSNGPAAYQAVVDLTGEGDINPKIQADPASVDFETVALNSSKSIEIIVSNIGAGNLDLGTITPPSGVDAAEFAVTGDACSGASLAPGATCSVEATFYPQFEGEKTAILTFISNDPDAPILDVNLIGKGSNIAWLIPILMNLLH